MYALLYALLKFLLVLLFICWGAYILAYAARAATTHPISMLGRMIRLVARGFLWGCVGLSKVLAFILSTLSDGLRRLLE
jgi:hypothetical protein